MTKKVVYNHKPDPVILLKNIKLMAMVKWFWLKIILMMKH